MMDVVRNWLKKNISNYVEIYVKADLKKIIKAKKKKIYHKKNIGDIVGLDIKPEFPKRPDIVIHNNFNKEIGILANILIKKLKKL